MCGIFLGRLVVKQPLWKVDIMTGQCVLKWEYVMACED